MSNYVSAAPRRLVVQRADHLCEYCLLHEDDTFFGCEVDHVISEKHDGPAGQVFLAYACALGFNREDRLLKRETLRTVGRYPSAAARERIARRGS